MFLEKGVLKICCKFTEERYGCSPVNLLHIFRTPFHKNTYVGLLLKDIHLYQALHYMMNSIYMELPGHTSKIS